MRPHPESVVVKNLEPRGPAFGDVIKMAAGVPDCSRTLDMLSHFLAATVRKEAKQIWRSQMTKHLVILMSGQFISLHNYTSAQHLTGCDYAMSYLTGCDCSHMKDPYG